MRTTLTIEDSISRKLREIASRSGKTYKEVVNETLRQGLSAPSAKRRYRLKASSLGKVHPEYDLVKSLQLADKLEDDEIIRKLNLRK
jgi:hypothetical protein